MQNLDPTVITFIVGLAVTNIGAIFGFYVSTKVGQAKLEVNVDRLMKDVDNLGNLYRNNLRKRED